MIASYLLALLQAFMSPADKPVHLVITEGKKIVFLIKILFTKVRKH